MSDRRLQEVYCPFEIRRTLRAAKDMMLSCLTTVVCSWDPITAGFIGKFLRFITRKWRTQFVFFQRCHRWVSGSTVGVMLETASIRGPVIIFWRGGEERGKICWKDQNSCKKLALTHVERAERARVSSGRCLELCKVIVHSNECRMNLFKTYTCIRFR